VLNLCSFYSLSFLAIFILSRPSLVAFPAFKSMLLYATKVRKQQLKTNYLRQRFERHELTERNTDISILRRRQWMKPGQDQGHAGHAMCGSGLNLCHCSTQDHIISQLKPVHCTTQEATESG